MEENSISRSISQLYSKVKKKPKKEIVKQPNKKPVPYETVFALLNKEKVLRTKAENRTISNYLCQNFEYFTQIKESGDIQKLEKVISVLNLERYSKNQPIIRFGEDGDKFYILMEGKVTLYKPMWVQKPLRLREYMGLMKNIKGEEVNDPLKYERINEKNAYLNVDLDMLFDMNLDPRSYKMNRMNTYFIEEDEELGEFGRGFAFGEIALIKRCTRNATIRAKTESYLLSIDKNDYKKILSELEEKRLEKELKQFKKEYPIFESWTLNQMIRLFNCFSKRTLTQGEYLYKQNEESDYVYIIEEGTFEVYSLISFGWLNDFLSYIISARNNLVHVLDVQNKQLKETELRELFDLLLRRVEPSPMKYDPLKVAKFTTSDNQKEDFVKIKLEEEEVNDPYNLVKLLLRTINYKEVIGLIDCLELKRRYNFVKCVSPHATVLKVSLYDFFRLVNINPEQSGKKILMNIIGEKKAILYKKIVNAAKSKGDQIERIFDFKYDKICDGDNSSKMFMEKVRTRESLDLGATISTCSPETPKKFSLKKNPKLYLSDSLSAMTRNNNTSLTAGYFTSKNQNSKSKTYCQGKHSISMNGIANSKNSTVSFTMATTPKIKEANKEQSFGLRKYGTNYSQNLLNSRPSNFSHFNSLSKKITSFDCIEKIPNQSFRNNILTEPSGMNSSIMRKEMIRQINKSIKGVSLSIEELKQRKKKFDIKEIGENKKLFLLKDYRGIFKNQIKKGNYAMPIIKPKTNRVSEDPHLLLH